MARCGTRNFTLTCFVRNILILVIPGLTRDPCLIVIGASWIPGQALNDIGNKVMHFTCKNITPWQGGELFRTKQLSCRNINERQLTSTLRLIIGLSPVKDKNNNDYG